MSTDALESLRADLLRPHPTAAPRMRWWWFGPAVERDELDRELTAMAAAGIGGVEVAFVYPLERATTTFGSPEMLADLRWAAERARTLGLRFDITLGSGWSFGGPHIDAALAARGLRWDRHEIGVGEHVVDVAAGWPGDELVAAFVAPGSAQEPARDARPAEVTRTPSGWRVAVDGGSGTRHVLLAWSRLTGQQVKRAAAGAEGPVLDHYSADAVDAHLRAVGDPILDAVPAELIGSVFCDSLEVYGADWTPDLPTEFERRRGYPLLPALALLLDPGAGDPARLRADYHRTLVDLYEERFVARVRAWAAARGVPFRIQGYGSPPATLSSYRFADAFEGEGWGWTELTATRWASSAAHHYGRDVVSAEAWTWLRSPSLRATPLDLVAEAHEHLLNGVTLLIGHGWPYSPADAPGPGWLFYAAACLDDRNPWWPAMPEVTTHLSRLCWLLRQGTGVADVAVYVPTTDLLAASGLAIGGTLDCWREANRVVTPEVVGAVRRVGLDYDLVDDEVVTLTEPDRPPVILVPSTTMLPQTTRRWLEDCAAAGSTVLLVDSTATVAGARSISAAELPHALGRAVETPFSEPGEIGMVHRRVHGLDVRVLVNTAATRQRTTVALTDAWQRWDTTGATVDVGHGDAPVELEPYQATILVSGPGVPTDSPVAVPGSEVEISLDHGWSVAFDGEPGVAVDLPHRWESERRSSSGAATYAVDVDLPPCPGAVLDLGEAHALTDGASPERGIVGPAYRVALCAPVGEIATVRVDGSDRGTLWAPPYRLDIGPVVGPGTTRIEITVRNTAANALGHDRELADLVTRTEERYGRRFVMQELDRALEDVSSGLLAVPVVRLTGTDGSEVRREDAEEPHGRRPDEQDADVEDA